MGTVRHLFDAVICGDALRVCEILRSKPSFANLYNLQLQMPLHLVFKNVNNEGEHIQADYRIPIINMLLENGADVNARDGENWDTPLHIAVKKEQLNGSRVLLMRGANPNAENIHHQTVMHYLTLDWTEVTLDLLELLMEFGGKPVVFEYINSNPNSWQIMVDAGAKSPDLYADLTQACNAKNAYLAKFLLINGHDLKHDGKFSLSNVLYCMSQDPQLTHKGKKFLIKILIELGIDINERINDERTALHNAVENNDYHLVKVLLENGADVSAKNIYEETPLHLLMYRDERQSDRNYRNIARVLVKNGADVNARNLVEMTPLCIAVKKDYNHILNMILAVKTGVDQNQLTKKINAAHNIYNYMVLDKKSCELYVAIYFGYNQVVDRMLKTRRRKNKDMYLSCAIEKKNYVLAKMLLEADYTSVDESIYTSLSKSNHIDLKLVSLLWTYNGISVLWSPLVKILFDIQSQNLAVNKLARLLVFCFSIDKCANNLSTEFEPIEGIFKQNFKFWAIYLQCSSKLTELKSNKVCQDISKYDILSIKFDSLVKRLNLGENLNSCLELYKSLKNEQKLRPHEYLLLERLDRAIHSAMIFSHMRECLSEAFESTLETMNFISFPDAIMWNILYHLNMRELKIIMKIDDENPNDTSIL